MPYVLKANETARHAAREIFGNANLYHDLHSPGWDGDPDSVGEGQVFYVQGERQGPPARHALDPKFWGKNRGY